MKKALRANREYRSLSQHFGSSQRVAEREAPQHAQHDEWEYSQVIGLDIPKLFTHFRDIADRASFDPSCGITLQNFKALVGEYHFGEDVKCQVCSEGGHCGHLHRHGFIGVTQDGKEGLIGNHCGRTYFGADANFAKECNRVTRENSISASLGKLEVLLNDRVAYETSLETAYKRLQYLRGSFDRLHDRLTPSIVQTLKDMAKSRNGDVYIQVEYLEVDENGKRMSEWINQRLGSLNGLGIWNYSTIGGVFAQIRKIRGALAEVQVTRDSGQRKLKKWADTFSSLPSVHLKIDDIDREFRKFTVPGNLEWLIFLVKNQSLQLETAKIALEFAGIQSPANKDAMRLIHTHELSIRSNNAGRNFRVPR